jgi:protein TonB
LRRGPSPSPLSCFSVSPSTSRGSAWAVAAAPLQSVAPEGQATSPGEPTLVHKVSPTYPPEAKAEKVEGVFLIDVRVGKDGAVEEAQVVASAPTPARLEELKANRGTPAGLEGDPRLAEAALAAVRQWRYEPILKGGQPVEFKLTVTVRFRLS